MFRQSYAKYCWLGERPRMERVVYPRAPCARVVHRNNPYYPAYPAQRTSKISQEERHLMPWNSKQYPLAWASEIRPAILTRGHHCCEGSPAYPLCRAANHQPHPVTKSYVVLTVAHTCRCSPPCGYLEHLLLLCQRCHLTMDAALHAAHAAETRRLQKEALGQLSFLAPP